MYCANRRGRDGLSATDEASDEQSEWVEGEWDHATDACAFVAKSARVAAIKDMRSGDW